MGYRNVQRFRGGLVVKAHKLLYHSTLGLRVIKKKQKCGLQTLRERSKGERERSSLTERFRGTRPCAPVHPAHSKSRGSPRSVSPPHPVKGGRIRAWRVCSDSRES